MISYNTTRARFPSRLSFHVNLLTSTFVVIGAGSAALRIPISRVAGLAALLGVLSFVLLVSWDIRRGRILWPNLLGSVFLLLAATALLWPAWGQGAFVSEGPDAWAYSSLGQYLDKYARGIDGGLAIIDQWGARLKNTRFSSASFLALAASWFRSDTCTSTLPFSMMVLAQLACGFALFTRMFGGSRLISLSAGVFACLLGWVPEILKLGNFDTLVFVSFLPFVLVRFRLLCLPGRHRTGILGFGLSAAALLYTYPEGLMLAGIVFIPFFLILLLRRSKNSRSYLPIIFGSLIAVSLVTPYMEVFWSFLQGQLQIGATTTIARGVFPGLLSSRWLPAFFALGEQFPGQTFSGWSLIFPAILLVLLAFGYRLWYRRHCGLFICVIPLLILCAWQGFWWKYDYGLYKVISSGWILIVPGIFIGLTELSRLLPKPQQRGWCSLGVALLFVGPWLQEYRNRSFGFFQSPRNQIEPYRELRSLRRVIGDRTLRVICQSAINEQWAVFYLRDLNIEVPVLMGAYLGDKNALPVLAKARRPNETATYTLVDASGKGGLWQNAIFSIRRTEPIEICGAEGQSGLENLNGKTFLWLGNQPTKIIVSSSANQRATFVIGRFIPGPSRPGDDKRTLLFRSDGITCQFDAKLKSLCYDFNLRTGINSIEIWCSERPTLARLPNGDPRTCLLGIVDVQIKPSAELDGATPTIEQK